MERAQGESRQHFEGAVFLVLTKNGDLVFFALGFHFPVFVLFLLEIHRQC